MIKSFILCVISIFFVYGVISFLFQFKKEKRIHIMKTFNDEDSIEAKLRLAMLKNERILVIDLGSSDGTLEIVKKMCNDYPIIELIEN